MCREGLTEVGAGVGKRTATRSIASATIRVFPVGISVSVLIVGITDRERNFQSSPILFDLFDLVILIESAFSRSFEWTPPIMHIQTIQLRVASGWMC